MTNQFPYRLAGRTLAVALIALLLPVPGVGQAAEVDAGAAIYQAQCARCHGADGQGGTDEYAEPLFGDLSLEELSELIDRTMPQDAPETCVDQEARQVAQYLFDTFYSPSARQAKGLATAPRIQRVRLTVTQYRNAVADLIGQVTPAPRADTRGRRGRGRRRPNDQNEPRRDADRRQEEPVTSEAIVTEPGLRAEYYQSKGMNKADSLAVQKIDQRLDFNFGEGGPVEGIEPDQFAIIWQGTLIAKDTGDYEFRIRTENGARLYLNTDSPEDRRKLRDDSDVAGQHALVDEWVSSGELREGTARVFLLGGREYPLRLEFFKYLEKTASIRLEWKPPHGTWSVLDSTHLTTGRAPRTFVVDIPFPADDRSVGYERGTSISQQWQAATTDAAVAAAAEVVDRLPLFIGDEDRSDRRRRDEDEQGSDPLDERLQREERIKQFVLQLAAIAYRRPLTSEEEVFYRDVLFANVESPEAAVRRAVVVMLQSPYFLYADLTPSGESPDAYAIASRLALTLWDSIPDAALREAAANGVLTTEEQVEQHARRLLADPRTKAKMRGFFHHWLEFEERDLAKDPALYPEFDEAVVADLRSSLDLFLEEVLWSETADYRQLLLANHLLLNDRLQSFYSPESSSPQGGPSPNPSPQSGEGNADGEGNAGEEGNAVPLPASEASGEGLGEGPREGLGEGPAFQRVDFPPDRRVGVLTHPYLLSAFAYHNNSSPIHRGVFLTRNIVGRPLKPPPAAVAFKEDEFAPDLTMREKITQLTRDSACMSCHSVINPLGFVLENYDAVGRWRTQDNDKPVNAHSQYTTTAGETLELRSARDVAEIAVASEAAHRAFVAQVFQHLVKQNPSAYGAETIDRLRREFVDDQFNMQNLLLRIAVRSAMHGLAASKTPSAEVRETSLTTPATEVIP